MEGKQTAFQLTEGPTRFSDIDQFATLPSGQKEPILLIYNEEVTLQHSPVRTVLNFRRLSAKRLIAGVFWV